MVVTAINLTGVKRLATAGWHRAKIFPERITHPAGSNPPAAVPNCRPSASSSQSVNLAHFSLLAQIPATGKNLSEKLFTYSQNSPGWHPNVTGATRGSRRNGLLDREAHGEEAGVPGLCQAARAIAFLHGIDLP